MQDGVLIISSFDTNPCLDLSDVNVFLESEGGLISRREYEKYIADVGGRES
jgi:hypothetical protein